MKTPPAAGLAAVLAVIISGMIAILFMQSKHQNDLSNDLRTLTQTVASQGSKIYDLGLKQASTARQVDVSVESLRSLLEQFTRLGNKDDVAKLEQALAKLNERVPALSKTTQDSVQSASEATRKELASLTAKLSEKPKIVPLRWAYVNKSKLREVARNKTKPAPLASHEDPEKDPELAKKLAEYESVQFKLSQFGHFYGRSSMFYPGAPAPQEVDKKKQEEFETLQIKLAELKPPLSAYLKQRTGNSSGHEKSVEQAIKNYAEGKFDLVIDKTFGDNDILYRSAQPVPDITDEVAKVLQTMLP